jgi:CRISPR/Cas system-associated protein Csm6
MKNTNENLNEAWDILMQWVSEQPFAATAPGRAVVAGQSQAALQSLPDSTVAMVDAALAEG